MPGGLPGDRGAEGAGQGQQAKTQQEPDSGEGAGQGQGTGAAAAAAEGVKKLFGGLGDSKVRVWGGGVRVERVEAGR